MKKILNVTLASMMFVYPFTTTLAAVMPSAKEEVVYANLDWSGEIESVYVVNILKALSGKVTDYGAYESIRNMTSTDVLNQTGDEISTTTQKEVIYYEGTLQSKELPWLIEMTYYLDGNKIEPQNLGGATGELEIVFNLKQNKKVTSSFFESYLLQLNLNFNSEQVSQLVAEGGTLANVGNQKQISYMILPNSEKEFSVKATVQNFEMDPIQIVGLKMGLALDEDTFNSGELNEKIQLLQDGTLQLSDASHTLVNGASDLNQGTTDINAGLLGLQTGMISIQTGLQQLSATSNTLTSGSQQFKQALSSLETALNQMQGSQDQLSQLLLASHEINNGLITFEQGIQTLQSQVNYLNYEATLKQNGLDLNALKENNTQASQQVQQLVEQLTPILPANEVEKLSNISTLLNVNNVVHESTKTYLNAASEGIASLATKSTELKENYQVFDTKMQQMVGEISKLMESVQTLNTAVTTITSSYEDFDSGLNDYVLGVEALTDGQSAIMLAAQSLVSGSNQLKTGSKQLYEGVLALNEGTSELKNNTANMDTQIEEGLKNEIEKLTGSEVETVSFTSEKNTNVQSVQFVMKTKPIVLPVSTTPNEQPVEKATFIQKLLNLFK